MKKKILLSTAYMALCLGAAVLPAPPAHAEETGTLAYYPISEESYRENYQEWKRFLEYHVYREPCQHYVDPPAGYVLRGCQVYRVETPVAAYKETRTVTRKVQTAVADPGDRTIYFDFDRSNLRPGERGKINGLAQEIRGEAPAHVIVAGHADRSGSEDYNMELSRMRAHTVTQALVAQGVDRSVISEKAYGETAPAVPTADGVKLQANRRTAVELRR